MHCSANVGKDGNSALFFGRERQAEALMQERGAVYIVQKCFRCETGEDAVPLVPIRHEGKSLWVCTRCLPTLIHG